MNQWMLLTFSPICFHILPDLKYYIHSGNSIEKCIICMVCILYYISLSYIDIYLFNKYNMVVSKLPFLIEFDII